MLISEGRDALNTHESFLVGLNHRPASIDIQVANVDAFRREGAHDFRQIVDVVRLIEGDVVP